MASFDAVALTELRHRQWATEVFEPRIITKVSGLAVGLDPWHVAIAMGVIHARATGLPSGVLAKGWNDLLAGRSLRLSGWVGKIGQWIKRRMVGQRDELVDFVTRTDQGARGEARHIPTIHAPWLTPAERRALQAAKERAAVYVTDISDKARTRVQELVTIAIDRGWDKDRLTESLERGWTHSTRRWRAVATTELQGAYNEGTVVHAIDTHGAAARVARVPEAGACEKCLELFLDAEGRPRIWDVAELVANGSNVGRKRDEWKATVWPIHTNGKCGTVMVSPGQEFNASWKLARAA